MTGWYPRRQLCKDTIGPCFSVIDIDELMSVLVMLGNPRTEEEVKIMIAEEDTNNDGVIDREEFFSMLQRQNQISSSES